MSRFPGRDALRAAGVNPSRRNKYGVAPAAERTVDGILFDSKAEAARWKELQLLVKAGQVKMVLRQVPFHLPGGIRYLCDFAVFWAGGTVIFEDVKGHKTDTYRVKKKLVEALYPVKIQEISMH